MSIDQKEKKDRHKPVFDTEKRHYYHVTYRKWDDVQTLTPFKYSMGRGETEPIFARICVCPSIALCFTAFHLDYDKYIVYRTKNEEVAVFPWKLSDKRLTEEMWLVEKTEFVRVGEVPIDLVNDLRKFLSCNDIVFGGGGESQKDQHRYKKHVFKCFEKWNGSMETKIENVKWM